MKIRRFRPKGLVPIEIWDLELDGELLSQNLERLADALELLRRGEGKTRWSRSPLWAARDFDSLFIGGGRPATLASTAYRVEASPDGAFVGEPGGIELLKRAGKTSGHVVDVGQSGIQVTSWGAETRRQTILRDAGQLPLRPPNVVDADVSEQRRRGRTFLARALRGGQAIVLALPCEIDPRGTPGRCSYIGWEGDDHLVEDALRLAGVADAEVWLLQDSELAGLSCPPIGKRTLVVTLGYGVAACVKLSS